MGCGTATFVFDQMDDCEPHDLFLIEFKEVVGFIRFTDEMTLPHIWHVLQHNVVLTDVETELACSVVHGLSDRCLTLFLTEHLACSLYSKQNHSFLQHCLLPSVFKFTV